MAGNGRGQMRYYNSNRSQSFIFVGLLVVIAILCFNYWNSSSRNSLLSREITDVTDKLRQTNMRKISVEKRNEALMQQVRENSEASNKANNEIKLKEEELGQVKDQVHEKDSMLSSHRSEIEELKQTLDTCQESEKIIAAEKEQCEKKVAGMAACETQVEDMEKNRKSLLDYITSERIRILSSLAKTYGKKLLEQARQVNIIVDDVPTQDLPEESQLPVGQSLPGAGTQGQALHFVSQNEASQNLNNHLAPQEGAGNLNLQNEQQANNLLPQFPNVQPVGNDNNVPQQINPNVQDPNAPYNAPVNINTNLNAGLGTQDAIAQKYTTFNNNQSNTNQENQSDRLSNQDTVVGAQLNPDIRVTTRPLSLNLNADANAQGNEMIPGERPQEGEFRMMGQQGAPAIIDQKPESNPAGDQVPLGQADHGLVAPYGDGIPMQQAPPGGDLAPQGVQEGEGPKGQDQINPPVPQDDRIEVREQRDLEANDANDAAQNLDDEDEQDGELNDDGEDKRRVGVETDDLENEEDGHAVEGNEESPNDQDADGQKGDIAPNDDYNAPNNDDQVDENAPVGANMESKNDARQDAGNDDQADLNGVNDGAFVLNGDAAANGASDGINGASDGLNSDELVDKAADENGLNDNDDGNRLNDGYVNTNDENAVNGNEYDENAGDVINANNANDNVENANSNADLMDGNDDDANDQNGNADGNGDQNGNPEDGNVDNIPNNIPNEIIAFGDDNDNQYGDDENEDGGNVFNEKEQEQEQEDNNIDNEETDGGDLDPSHQANGPSSVDG